MMTPSQWLTLWPKATATTSSPTPGKAMDIMARLLEYNLPKLARVEMSGTPGAEPIRLVINK